jgi:hypothetical protein
MVFIQISTMCSDIDYKKDSESSQMESIQRPIVKNRNDSSNDITRTSVATSILAQSAGKSNPLLSGKKSNGSKPPSVTDGSNNSNSSVASALFRAVSTIKQNPSDNNDSSSNNENAQRNKSNSFSAVKFPVNHDTKDNSIEDDIGETNDIISLNEFSSMNSTLESTMKALLLPKDADSAIPEQSPPKFDDVLNYVRDYQIDVNDLMIFPLRGFVVKAAMNAKHDIIINVCHHPSVGKIRSGGTLKKFEFEDPNAKFPDKFPQILGTIQNDNEDFIPDKCYKTRSGKTIARSKVQLIVDIVIPSAVYKMFTRSRDDSLMDELVGMVLSSFLDETDSITFNSLKLSGDYDIFTDIPGNYIGPPYDKSCLGTLQLKPPFISPE